MRIGKLRQRVLIARFLTTHPDGAGGTLPEKKDVGETWANITPMRGARLFEYNKIVQATWYDVTLRFRESVPFTKDLAIEYRGRFLTIHSVLNQDEKRRVLNVAAYEHD